MRLFGPLRTNFMRYCAIMIASLVLLYVAMLGPTARVCMYGQVDAETVLVIEWAYWPLFNTTCGTALGDLLYWYRDLWVFSSPPGPYVGPTEIELD